jgi:hypothetical protein
MIKPAEEASLHAQHVKWALMFANAGAGAGAFGWESPEQFDHRFYELRRDAIHQGSDRDPYRIWIDPGTPEELLKSIGERREFFREEFRKIFHEIAKDNGKFELSLGKAAKLTLRPVTDLYPFQITFETGIDPIIEALLVHIAYSRAEGCRIRRCAKCEAVFLREGRRPSLDEESFCSVSCARAAATKRYRDDQKKKAAAAKAESSAPIPARRAPAKKKGRRKL